MGFLKVFGDAIFGLANAMLGNAERTYGNTKEVKEMKTRMSEQRKAFDAYEKKQRK